jgi:hypothetical protein
MAVWELEGGTPTFVQVISPSRRVAPTVWGQNMPELAVDDGWPGDTTLVASKV